MFYLKYRPQKFSDLHGLESVSGALINQLKSNNIAHAYLFYGPRGSGKTTTARLLAKALNCSKKQGSEPCNKCDSCKAIVDGRYLDLIEIDAASNRGIDDIRDLKDKVKLAPTTGKLKFYIIDEIHMLTKEAFNALLKTLEEPPKSTYFVLCTTEPQKVPDTIKSRCQQFEFKRAREADLVSYLRYIVKAEKSTISKSDLEMIAKASVGGYRDAATFLEQMIVGGLSANDVLGGAGLESVAELINHIIAKDTQTALIHINKVYESGADLSHFVSEVLEYIRNLMLISAGVGEELVDVSQESFRSMQSQAGVISDVDLAKMIDIFFEAKDSLKSSVIPQLPLECAIIKLAGKNDVKRDGSVKLDPVPKDPEPKGQMESKGKGENRVSEIEGKWGSVLKKVKPYNRSIEAFLSSSKPKYFDGTTLTLEVFYTFHKERLDLSRNRQIVEMVLGKVMNTDIKIKTVVGSKGAKGDLVDSNIEAPEDGNIAQKAVEVFSGELDI